MATGDTIDRRNRNEDILDTPKWIIHPTTGVLHKVLHKYHAQRLVAEGGRVVSGPDALSEAQTPNVATEDLLKSEIERLKAEVERLSHASTGLDGLPDNAGEALNKRPSRR